MKIDNVNSLIDIIDRDLAERSDQDPPYIIAIDGMSGAGKSSLALFLAQQFHCDIVHADDFFLRPEQRTRKRLEEAGGNFDRERFEEEILKPLTEGKSLHFRPFDCKKMKMEEENIIKPSELIIVEGSYSLHPDLCPYYDLKIFLKIDQKTQADRIVKREGREDAEKFFSTWIPMENKTFKAFQTEELADFAMTNLSQNSIALTEED